MVQGYNHALKSPKVLLKTHLYYLVLLSSYACAEFYYPFDVLNEGGRGRERENEREREGSRPFSIAVRAC